MFLLHLDVADAFGSVDYMTLGKALRATMKAPLARLIFGASLNIHWCGHIDAEEIPMRRGGSQGVVEVPQLREYLDHVLGDSMETCSQNRWGGEIPSTAVGKNGARATTTPPLHKADCDPYLDHVVWADYIILASTSLATLQAMVKELMPALLAARPGVKPPKFGA